MKKVLLLFLIIISSKLGVSQYFEEVDYSGYGLEVSDLEINRTRFRILLLNFMYSINTDLDTITAYVKVFNHQKIIPITYLARNSNQVWEMKDKNGCLIAFGMFQFYQESVSGPEKELFHGQRMVVMIGEWNYFDSNIPYKRIENSGKENSKLTIP